MVREDKTTLKNVKKIECFRDDGKEEMTCNIYDNIDSKIKSNIPIWKIGLHTKNIEFFSSTPDEEIVHFERPEICEYRYDGDVHILQCVKRM